MRSVVFDALPDSPFRYVEYGAVVCIDVLLAATTLVTSANTGRRTLPALDSQHAARLCSKLGPETLVAGANAPDGHTLVPNSPLAIHARQDTERPLVLASALGTSLIVNAADCQDVFITCFRNIEATARAVAESGADRVAVIAACSRGQLRCEDLMAAARLIRRLLRAGLTAADDRTIDMTSRWAEAPMSLIRMGASAEELLGRGHAGDLEFVLEHIDDLPNPCKYRGGEVSEWAARNGLRIVTPPDSHRRPVSSRVARG